MIPRKLRAYTPGRPTHQRRVTYSTVKSAVKNHSAPRSSRPCSARIDATLSSMITATLARMATIRSTSKARPAQVSCPKMIS